MAGGSNPFARALGRHPADAVRAAFDRCNQVPGLHYDRTALDRWMKGSLPSRRDFVLALADQLGDQLIHDAWLEARGESSDSNVKRVVTSFIRLPDDARADAARQIEAHLVSLGPTVREQLTMLVDQAECLYPPLRRARIHLDVSYPFPAGQPIFPILFRGYQVRGTLQIRLALRSPRAHTPRSYAFLGHRRDWGEGTILDELHIEAGHEDQILGSETGLVLTWSEAAARRSGDDGGPQRA